LISCIGRPALSVQTRRRVGRAVLSATGYDAIMSDRVVVHLPPMPQPKDFGLDTKSDDRAAGARYEKALDVWERVVRDIARRIGKKKK
jgi:hypothetical protein